MAARMASFRKIVVKKLTTNFSDATEIVSAQMPKPKPTEVLIKSRYLGINATDINITAGRYLPSNNKRPGFIAGLETVGEIEQVGSEVSNLKVGQAVGYMAFGCFSEYLCVPSDSVWTLPEVKPEFLSFLVCGKTALIGLDRAGRIKKGDIVLITAAAGGTGHIAVQYAKRAECHVIALCSSDEKAQVLRELGANRVINYKTEKLSDVLKEEYPNGVDVVWETVGGEVFNTCVANLAIKGRLIIVGYITNYKSEFDYKAQGLESLPAKLLTNSASVNGFMLLHYTQDFQYYHAQLLGLYELNKLTLKMDQGENSAGGVFKGLESVSRAVEHLHSGKSIGKIFVEI